jgi:hypothetical protein
MKEISRKEDLGPDSNEALHWVRPNKAARWCGIRKSRLYQLLLEANGQIKTCVLKSPGATRGARLINLESLLAYIEALAKQQKEQAETETNEKKEPTAGTRGLVKKQDDNYGTHIIENSEEINDNSKLPILRGFRFNGLVIVHCPWCDRMHAHGWGRQDSASVTEIRCAHCANQPGAPSAYRISVFRMSDLKKTGYLPVNKKGGSTHAQ